MVALVALLVVVTIALGERIGVNNGEGWDGQAYSSWARDFDLVLRGGVTRYQAQRVVPSAIVYYAHAALGVAHARAAVIVSFQILDGLALVASAWLLYRIARALAWSRAATWAAFASTFLAFANARHQLYYPTLTDATAFLLGTAMVWAYVERRPIALAIVAAVSTVTWPALLPLALVALVLPRPREPVDPVTWRALPIVAIAVGVATAALVAGWLLWYRHAPYPGAETFYARSRGELIVPAIAACAAVCGAAAYGAARSGRTWALARYARTLRLGPTLAALGVVAAIVVARGWWVDRVGRAGEGGTLAELVGRTAAYTIRGPLWNIVFAIVYYGPIVIVAIAAWRRVAATAATLGPAMVACVAMTILLGVTSESRQLLHLFPFVVVATIEATREMWTRRLAIIVAALALVWSKLWWKFGYDSAIDTWDWPNQRYVMHEGPWACYAAYVAHLAAAVVTAIVLYVAFSRRERSAAPPPPPPP
jgi:hypothetical protein